VTVVLSHETLFAMLISITIFYVICILRFTDRLSVLWLFIQHYVIDLVNVMLVFFVL